MQIEDMVEIERNLLVCFIEVACFCHSSESRDVCSMRILSFFSFVCLFIYLFQCIN